MPDLLQLLGLGALPTEIPPVNQFWLPAFHVELDALALVLVLLGMYFTTASQLRQTGRAYPLPARQVWCWVAGCATILVGSSWPIHDLSERYLFAVHMVQHMLYVFVAAPLLLMGLPDWLADALIGHGRWRKVVAFLTRPLVAFLVFNVGQAITHVPEVTQVIITNHPLHFLVHLYIVASALLLWWPVLSPLPDLPRLSYPLQMLFLMLQSVIPTVIYAPLTYAEDVVYPFYGQVPHIWGLNAVMDQQMAGLLMKIGGGFIVWGWIGVVFMRWVARAETATTNDEFSPISDLTPASAVRAAEDVVREGRQQG